MAKVNKSALVPYSAKTMFDLVNDVIAYPEFIPGCVATRINSVDETHMQASLDISNIVFALYGTNALLFTFAMGT